MPPGIELTLDEYLAVRDRLIDLDLVAFDGTRFQVLSLPPVPSVSPPRPLVTQDDLEDHDPATIRRLLQSSLALLDRSSGVAPSTTAPPATGGDASPLSVSLRSVAFPRPDLLGHARNSGNRDRNATSTRAGGSARTSRPRAVIR
jgi:hypothetical protein